MSRPKKTNAERDVMRERILSAAGDLLESRGPADVSIRAVTARLGISPMAFYSYYASRDVLLNKLGERQLCILLESGEQFLVSAGEEGADVVLRDVVRLFAQSAFERPHSYLLQWALPVEETAGLCLHRQRFETVLNLLGRLIETGIQQGHFRPVDPAKAALTLFSLVNGPLLLHTAGRLPDAGQLGALLAETERLAMLYLTARDG